MNGDRVWTFYSKVYDAINHNVPYTRMLDEIIGELSIEQPEKSTVVLDAGRRATDLYPVCPTAWPEGSAPEKTPL